MSYDLDQYQVDLYKNGGTNDTYSWATGTFVLPLAVTASADQEPVVVVQAHAPYRLRTVRFRYTKQHTPPKLPKPVSTGAFTFVGGAMTVPAPTPNINGTFEWQAAGQLNFVSAVYNDDSDGYILSSPPYVYRSQQGWGGGSSNAPLDVQEAGIGPKVGWYLGNSLSFTDPSYAYNEPTYLPGGFFSEDLLNGPSDYPSFQ